MFPEITRDDIFRLETARMWLRWPRAADVDAILAYAGDPEVALKTAVIPQPYARLDAESFVLRARAENAEGEALYLALAPKRQPNGVLGMISLHGADNRGAGTLGFVLERSVWNQGLMTEAALAFVDLIFSVTALQEIVSCALPSNLASLRVLEKLGFARLGRETAHWPARGGEMEVERLALKRGAARSLFGARRPRLASS
jgi:RimJ/RimL family protein N-acetyltransferase